MDWFKICEGCGECCGAVPLPRIIFTKYKHLGERKYQIKHFNDEIVPVTEDMVCIFLDKNKRCKIYIHRPKVCRDFGVIPALPCKKINPEASLAKQKEIDRMLKEVNNEVF